MQRYDPICHRSGAFGKMDEVELSNDAQGDHVSVGWVGGARVFNSPDFPGVWQDAGACVAGGRGWRSCGYRKWRVGCAILALHAIAAREVTSPLDGLGTIHCG